MNWEENTIKKFVKKKKLIVYGAQSIKKQLGMYGRSTIDYDIYSKTPLKHSKQLEKKLDSKYGNKYYVKPAMHKGTFKVKHIGKDGVPKTRDDLDVADFSRPTRKVKTKIIDGIRYTNLSESVKDKKKSLSDKEFQFRWKKDQDDLDRINFFKKMKKIVR